MQNKQFLSLEGWHSDGSQNDGVGDSGEQVLKPSIQMKKDDCYQVGKVTQPHGVKGEVKIWLDVDEPDYYADLDSVLLDVQGQLIPYFVQEIAIRDKKSIARFEGMKTWEDTQPIIGCDIYLPLTKLPQLKDDQYYFHEIIGFDLIHHETKEKIGVIAAVFEGGGQDLLSFDVNGKEVLAPINDEIIVRVDKPNKQLFVNLPDGLIELYTEE